MIRLHVVAEGQTEETFVNLVLAPHLAGFEVVADAHCVTTGRHRGRPFRGGLISYAKAKRDISLWLKQDRRSDARFTTFFDLYGLPRDFPGYEEAGRLQDPYERVAALERAIAADGDIADRRFVPYIQLHEFEALLLVNPRELASEFIEHEQGIENLVSLCERYDSPERINDGVDTAPSKRIIQEIPAYEGRKRSSGPLVAERIGLDALRESCPHFGGWLDRLEALEES